MGASLTILKYELISFLNSYLKTEWGLIKAVLIGIASFSIASISFIFSWLFFMGLKLSTKGVSIESSFLSIFFLIVFTFVILQGFSIALYTMFLQSNIIFLMKAPVSIGAIFKSKLVQNVALNSLIPFLFGIPAVLAYFISFNFPIIAYVLLFPVFFAVIVIPAGIIMVLITIIMRFISAKRAKEFLGLAGAFAGAMLYILINVSMPGRIALNFKSNMNILKTEFLPSSWASSLFSSLKYGSWNSILYAFLLFGTASVVVIISLRTMEKLFFQGWTESKVSTFKSKSSKKSSYLKRLYSFLPRPVRAIAIKDLKSMPRDIQFWSRMFFPLALMIIIIMNPGFSGKTGEMQFFLDLLILGFAAMTFSNNLLTASVGSEGKAYWILHTSPVKPEAILKGKLSAGLLPLLTIIFIMASIIGFLSKLGWSQFALLIPVSWFLTFGISSISIGIGGAFANFESENPRKKVNFLGSIASMVLPGGYLIIAVILLASPYIARYFGKNIPVLYIISWGLLFLMTIFISYVSIKIGARTLGTREFNF